MIIKTSNSYNQTAGKRFQMSMVSDTNYLTAMVEPTAGDSIREAHSYEYDNNGNEVIIITPRSGAKDNPVSSDRLDTLKIVKTNKYDA